MSANKPEQDVLRPGICISCGQVGEVYGDRLCGMCDTSADDAHKPIAGDRAYCHYCHDGIVFDGQNWVDLTDGDCCSGNDACENENEQHTPTAMGVSNAS